MRDMGVDCGSASRHFERGRYYVRVHRQDKIGMSIYSSVWTRLEVVSAHTLDAVCLAFVCVRLRTSAFICICLRASVCVCIRPCASASLPP